MKRALAILACLLVGHAVAAGLFWWFVNVPESNAAMLALSSAVIILLVVVLGWTEAAAVLLWDPTCAFRRAARRAFGVLPAFVVGLLVFALFWWITASADAWATEYSGEIDAWWMAKTGSAKTAWIHSGLGIALWLVRYVIGVSLALAVLAAGAQRGAGALVSVRWLRAGLSQRQLGAIGLAMLVLMWLPLRATYWRPGFVPPTIIETVFVAAKLGLLYVILNAGWALILRAAAFGASSRPSSS